MSKITLAEVAAPSTPDSGKVALYAKADGLVYSKDDAGTETLMSSGAGGGAPTDATYIVQTANGTLTNEQALGALATGIVKNTTTTGVLSIAAAGTDYLSPAGAETVTNKTISASANTVGMGSGVIKTIATGVAAAGSDRNLIIAAESGTADDLIEVTGLTVGESALLRADTGDTITVKHNDAGATVKIHLYGNADVVLDEQNPLRLSLVATNVLVQDIDASAAGGATVVSANKVHKFGANQSTTSGTMVDVDATNAAITATLTGSGKCLVIFNFYGGKATAGSGYFRITDGTNSSAEVEMAFAAGNHPVTLNHVFTTSAGSTTYKLQYRSSDANAMFLIATIAVGMSLMEIA